MSRYKRPSKWIADVCLAAVLLPIAGCSSSSSKPENFTTISGDDPEMAAAIDKARKTLPEFWKHFDQRASGESSFALKVKITDPNGIEHFWLTDLKHDGKVTGVINNDPEIVKSVKLGQQYEIPDVDISDWMYVRNGKIYGNETVRPLYKTMSPEESASVKKMMANP